MWCSLWFQKSYCYFQYYNLFQISLLLQKLIWNENNLEKKICCFMLCWFSLILQNMEIQLEKIQTKDNPSNSENHNSSFNLDSKNLDFKSSIHNVSYSILSMIVSTTHWLVQVNPCTQWQCSQYHILIAAKDQEKQHRVWQQ